MSVGDISKTNPKPTTNINALLENWCKVSEACLKRFMHELNLEKDTAMSPQKKEGSITKTLQNDGSPQKEESPSKEWSSKIPKHSPEKVETYMNYEVVLATMFKKVKKWMNTKTTGDRALNQNPEEQHKSRHAVKKLSKEYLEKKVQEALKADDLKIDTKEEVEEEYLQTFPIDVSKVADSSEIDIYLKEELTESASRRKTEVRRHCILPSCNDSVTSDNAKDLYKEMCLHVYREHPEVEGPMMVAQIHKSIRPPVSMAGKKEAREKRLQKLLLKGTLTLQCFTCSAVLPVEDWLPHMQSHEKVRDPFQCPYCNLQCKKTDKKKRSCMAFIHSTDKHLPQVKNMRITTKGKTHKICELIQSLDRKFEVRAFRHSARYGQAQVPKEKQQHNEKSLVANKSPAWVKSNLSEMHVESGRNDEGVVKHSLKRRYSGLGKHSAHKKRHKSSSMPKDCVVLVDMSSRPICYTCVYCCNKQFTNESSFERHVAFDHPVCNLKCHDCLEMFKDVNVHLKVCSRQLTNQKQEKNSDCSSEGIFVIDLDRESSLDAGWCKGGTQTVPGVQSEKLGKHRSTSDVKGTPDKKDEEIKQDVAITETPLSIEKGTTEDRKVAEVKTSSKIAEVEPGRKIAEIEPGRRVFEVEPDRKIAKVEPDRKIVKVEPDRKIAEIERDRKIAEIESDRKIAKVESDRKIAKVEPDRKIHEVDPSVVQSQPRRKLCTFFSRSTGIKLSVKGPTAQAVTRPSEESREKMESTPLTKPLEKENESSIPSIDSPDIIRCSELEKSNVFKELEPKKQPEIQEIINAVSRGYTPNGPLFYCNYKDCHHYLGSEKDLRIHKILEHYWKGRHRRYLCLDNDCKVTATNFKKEMRPHLLQAHGNLFKKLVESSFQEAKVFAKDKIKCPFKKCGFIAKSFEALNEHTLLHNNYLQEKVKRLPLGTLTWSVLWCHGINNRQNLEDLTYLLHKGFCPPCNISTQFRSSSQIYLHLLEHMNNVADKNGYHESAWLIK